MRLRPRTLVLYGGLATVGLLTGLAGNATYASFTGVTQSTSVLTAAPDWVAPTVSSSVIAKSTGGEPGYLHGTTGQYYVYATVVDSGNPASGISTVTANVSSFHSGQTALALVAGSYPLFGQTYNYRSAAVTTPIALANGTYSFSVSAADTATNSGTATGYSVTGDNTAPTATDIQAVNGGGTFGKPDIGDIVTYTASEPIDPHSILSGWTGTATNVVVRVTDASSQDTLAVYDSANTTQLKLGSVNLNKDLVTANVTFGATGSPSTLIRSGNSFVLTLGSLTGTTLTSTASVNLKWSPLVPAVPADRAGNAVTTALIQEQGTADANF